MIPETMKHIAFRPSMGPGVALCPSYMYRRAGPRVVSLPNTFSSLGTAIHKAFELYISRGETATQEQLQEIAHKYNVGMAGYYGLAWRVNLVAEKWQAVSQYFTSPEREVELKFTASNGYPIVGHPDLMQVWDSYAVVADLKSGETEGIDHFAQGAWYAWLVWRIHKVPMVYVIIFAPLLDVWETRQFTADHLAELEAKFEEWCAQAGHIYSGPNPMCRFCENATNCPAMSKAIDPVIAELSAIRAQGRDLTPHDIEVMRPLMKAFERWAAQFHEAEKILVERFGAIDLGDGTELVFTHDTRTEFKPVETVSLLAAEGIPQDKTIAEMKISKEAVKGLARIISVPRSRDKGIAATQKRLVDLLEANGATEEKPWKRLQVRNIRIQKPQEESV